MILIFNIPFLSEGWEIIKDIRDELKKHNDYHRQAEINFEKIFDKIELIDQKIELCFRAVGLDHD